MADTGATYPGTAATQAVSPEDDQNWDLPDNIKADDGVNSGFCTGPSGTNYSYRLKATNFGFSIPDGATITGIKVEIERYETYAGANVKDYRVQLLDADGNLVGDNKAATTTEWPTSVAIATYGGATDTWNASPTEAMVEDADFGVVLSATGFGFFDNYWGMVDFIRITVYYSVGVTHELAGVISGVASVSGVALITRGLAGLASGLCSVSGLAVITYKLAGITQGVASVSGFAAITRTLAGLSSGVASVTASLSVAVTHWLAGVASGVASITADLTNLKWLAGVISGVCSTAGNVLITRGLAGLSSGVAYVTASLINIKWLAGVIAGVATVTGNLFHVRVAIRVLAAVRNLVAARNIPPVR